MSESNRDLLNFLRAVVHTESNEGREELVRQALSKASESDEFAEALEGFVNDRSFADTWKPTTIYRLYNAEGQLLYVGITGLGMARLKEHSKKQPWWTEVASASFEHCGDRESALRGEESLIKTLKPKYNVVHNQRVPDAREAMLGRMVKSGKLPDQCYEVNT